MRYRLFGPTGLRVSELFLGAITFGEQGGVGAPPEECALILDTFADPPHAQYLDQAAKPTGIAAGSGLVLYFWGPSLRMRGRARSATSTSTRCICGFRRCLRARDPPRHSPSYRLTTLIAEIESMGVRATSAEGHRVPDWYRLSSDTRVTGIANTPSRRSS
jgi:hypothetical protein